MNPFSKVWWIVEFFSGCANLSKTCAAAGFHAIAYDILYGPGNDLLCKQTLAAAIKFINLMQVHLFGWGPPALHGRELEKTMVVPLLFVMTQLA